MSQTQQIASNGKKLFGKRDGEESGTLNNNSTQNIMSQTASSFQGNLKLSPFAFDVNLMHRKRM